MKKSTQKGIKKLAAFSIALAFGFFNFSATYAVDTVYKEVIPLKYEYASKFQDGLAVVMRDGKVGFIDKTGKEVLTPYLFVWFNEGMAVIKQTNEVTKYGYLDKTGEPAIQPQYDSADDFSEGLAIVSKSERKFYIDKTGKEIISVQYDEAKGFKDDRALVGNRNTGKYGYIDKTGKTVIPLKYDDADDFSEGMAAVGIDGKNGYVDKSGKEVIELKYDYVNKFSDGLALVGIGEKQCYYIDKAGKEVIKVPDKYIYAGRFSEGMALVAIQDKDGEKYGYIDKSGKEVISCKYQADFIMGLSDFKEGLAQVAVEGKCGYIDKTGKVVVPFEYDIAYNFKEGMAPVSKNGKWGFITVNQSNTISSVEPDGIKAVKTSANVLVDGKTVEFDAYNINGSNYFKLRDVAFIFKGTAKKFNVSWDAISKSVSLKTGKEYIKVGGEMAKTDEAQKTALKSDVKVTIDGKEAKIEAYNIGGNNYFKLRDLGKEIRFGVDWNKDTNSIAVNTKKGYSEK
ncbi:MAG: WG repeat-containing protein [Eubacteriales bacterium]